jgi:Holliday junction resolvase
MTHRSKRKGSVFELEVVRRLQNRGLAAEKMPLSGALPNYSGDIAAPHCVSDAMGQYRKSKR